MKIAKHWEDFEVVATGNGEKLERWGNVHLLRPEPQAIWKNSDLSKHPKLNAKYLRSQTGGGMWHNYKKMPDEWTISWKELKFLIKPMGFKHTGLFPEQAVNWEIMQDMIKNARREIKVLNLFAYTGGATVACLSAGASVCHVDASKGMVDRAKQNVELSGLAGEKVRYIVDDCMKFIKREIRRGNKYDAVIMDPPSYGRGPNGEMWKLEDCISEFLEVTREVLSDSPLFVLLNSYTTGLQPTVMSNLLTKSLEGVKGSVEAYEVCLNTSENGIYLPCGASGLFKGEQT